ncbi:tetratricopeptide repeat protein [Helicobacter suis]|uniref:tetratricopeptide repeat protein n=1 Tax=Helicobacter suis TaxID=104628 RepID=UPI0013D06BD5|nr:tetratricopeptide repeat protein [Helicobacter suis]
MYSQDQSLILKEAEIAYKSKDYPKAFKLYQQGAKAGYAQAFYHLGLMYSIGQYVDLDHDKAIENFKKAGKMGVVDAYLKLAHMALDNKGVSCKEAFIYYQKALDLNQKIADVYMSLGHFYLFATSRADCPADYNAYPNKDKRYYQKGMFYLEKAGEMANFKSYMLLGDAYRRGDPGFVWSYKKAKQYYLKAAEVLKKTGEKGDSQAYNELGLIYKDYGDEDPRGTLNDGHKSVAYFQKAIVLGNSEAYTWESIMNMGVQRCVEMMIRPNGIIKRQGSLEMRRGMQNWHQCIKEKCIKEEVWGYSEKAGVLRKSGGFRGWV